MLEFVISCDITSASMQVARFLARPRRFSLANAPSCRNGVLNSPFHAELGGRFCEVKGPIVQPFVSRLVSTITSRESRLNLLNPIQLTVNNGKNFGRRWVCGLAVGSTYLSRLSGLTEASRMEQGEDISAFKSDFAEEWENRQYLLGRWVRRLWIPSLCLLTIVMGWHYPTSLLVNILFLMWSTRPSPSSIYMWVEQKRQQEALEKRGLDRVRAQVSGLLENPAVMHVEVRDHKLFCLARVTSLTKKSTMLGILGDWWVIYSSTSAIHTGMNMRNLIATVPPFVKEQFSMS